jgi:hypothetical protein
MIKNLAAEITRDSLIHWLKDKLKDSNQDDNLPFFHVYLSDLGIRLDCSLDLDNNLLLTIIGNHPYLELIYLANIILNLAPDDWNIKQFSINGKINNYIPLPQYEQTK